MGCRASGGQETQSSRTKCIEKWTANPYDMSRIVFHNHAVDGASHLLPEEAAAKAWVFSVFAAKAGELFLPSRKAMSESRSMPSVSYDAGFHVCLVEPGWFKKEVACHLKFRHMGSPPFPFATYQMVLPIAAPGLELARPLNLQRFPFCSFVFEIVFKDQPCFFFSMNLVDPCATLGCRPCEAFLNH